MFISPDFIYLVLSLLYSLVTGPASLKVWVVDEILGIFRMMAECFVKLRVIRET